MTIIAYPILTQNSSEVTAFRSNSRSGPPDGSGTALIRVPKHSGDITFRLDPQGPISGTLLVRYNGEEQDSNGVVGSWTRVDLSGRYQLSDKVELYARVENLLDEHYQQILGYGTPGLSGSIGGHGIRTRNL